MSLTIATAPRPCRLKGSAFLGFRLFGLLATNGGVSNLFPVLCRKCRSLHGVRADHSCGALSLKGFLRSLSLYFPTLVGLVKCAICLANSFLGHVGVGTVVTSNVRALIGQFKVFNPVIGLVAVDVMHDFVRKKITAKMGSHNEAMLFNVTVRHGHRVVRGANDNISAAGFRFAALPTRVVRALPRSRGGLCQFGFGLVRVVEALASKAGRLPLSDDLWRSLVSSRHDYPKFHWLNASIHNMRGA